MGKKLLFLVNLLLFAMVIQAAPVSKSEAQEKALQFISGKLAGSRGTTVNTPYLQYESTNGDNYYVFNVGEQQGFVIVSGDDRAPTILGYSNEGAFDAESIPDNMKVWLQGYADGIQELKSESEVAGARRAAPEENESWAAVGPLIETKWNQTKPYNNLLDGNVTGCVATAMAQVMNYHKWPEGATTAIPKYSTYSSLPSTTFDWSNMKNEYSGSESDAAINAVATLMKYCGYSVEMKYGTNASSAYSSDAVDAFAKYFGYDQNVRIINRSYFSIDEWETIIYDEIANNRPVMYTGSTVKGSSGHAFVCDGYDGNGLFHFNWGWGGRYDGFFVLWSANPKGSGTGGSGSADGYSSSQSAIIGVQRPTGEVVQEELKLSVMELRAKQNTYTRSSRSRNFSGVQICPVLINKTSTSFRPSYGFDLYEGDNKVKNILSKDYSSTLDPSYYINKSSILGTYSYTYSALDAFGANMTGTYKIIPVSKKRGTSTWLKSGGSDLYYIEATITDTELKLRVMPYVDLEVTKVEYTRNKMAKIMQEVKVTIMNNGSEYNGNLYLMINDATTASSAEQVALRAGQETDVYFHYTPEAGGTDTWYICTEENKLTSLSGGTGTQTIEPYSSTDDIDLDMKMAIHNKTLDNYVFGENLTATITAVNTSSQVYEGKVGLYLNGSKFYYSPTILPGDSVSYNFTKDIEIGKSFRVAPTHSKNGNWKYAIKTYTAAEGVEIMLEDGTSGLAVAESEYRPTPAITAVDLRGVKTVKSVNAADADPNCIFVVDEDADIQGLEGVNVIKGTSAENIQLTDESIGFMPPIDFTASQISYERTFTQGTDGTGSGWTTIVLPFDVDKVMVGEKEIDWFHSKSDKGKNFWLRELVSDGVGIVSFGYVEELKANTPYIIAVPGDNWGEDWDLTNKKLKFIGKENANIVKNAEAETGGDHYTFVGTTVSQTLSDVYALNETGSTFSHGEATIAPFRAYFTPIADSNASRLVIRSADGQTTTITMPEREPLTTGDAYMLDGRKVKGNLPKGVYIVNGKKMMK